MKQDQLQHFLFGFAGVASAESQTYMQAVIIDQCILEYRMLMLIVCLEQ